jgi:uncharacterized membrane protein
MSLREKWNHLRLSLLIVITLFTSQAVSAVSNITLYTPYTKISVPPGEPIDYTIDVINNGDEVKTVDLSASGIPSNWNYTLKSGGWVISQLSILPKEKKSVSLRIEVPFQVNKGNYRFKVQAGELGSLPLVINVSEKGTYETEFTTDQPNMEGNSNSTFTFRAKLDNHTTEQQLYALMAEASRGWNVLFRVAGKQVTSVEMDANTSKDISIEITAPSQIEAGKYRIPVSAVTNSTTAKLDLEVVVSGTFSMELSTPSGLLSSSITAGDEKKLELVVKNTGSSPLVGVQLSSSTPANWSVQFDPKKVDVVLPGKEAPIYVTIKADKKAIPGDYVVNMDAKTPEVTAKTALRVAVKTSMLWGWTGILIIVGALSSVFYLFRKYGRR